MKLITIFTLLLIGQITFGQDNFQKIDSFLTSHYNNGNLNGNVLIAENALLPADAKFIPPNP